MSDSETIRLAKKNLSKMLPSAEQVAKNFQVIFNQLPTAEQVAKNLQSHFNHNPSNQTQPQLRVPL